MRKLACNNPNLDLVNIHTYTKFSEMLSFCSQDIERKQNYGGRNDGQPKYNIAPTFSKRGYNNSKYMLSSYLGA